MAPKVLMYSSAAAAITPNVWLGSNILEACRAQGKRPIDCRVLLLLLQKAASAGSKRASPFS
jgi:hypothetical protein